MTAPSPAEKLKSGLARREKLLVVNIDYSNASLVEFLARNGADVIFIDCEQGDTGIETIPDLVRAAHIAGTPVLVRLFSSEAGVIERYLFRGVDGIVIPRLETADQVREVVETMKYCFPTDYRDKSLVIQIETLSAARNLPAILKIDGVDAFFIGPVDLAKSMGHGGDFREIEVAREIDRLILDIAKAERSAGMLVTDATIRDLAVKGVNFLYLHTNDFLKIGCTMFVEAKSGERDSGPA